MRRDFGAFFIANIKFKVIFCKLKKVCGRVKLSEIE